MTTLDLTHAQAAEPKKPNPLAEALRKALNDERDPRVRRWITNLLAGQPSAQAKRARP
jgi:hypothetical protein